jgi:hypothetical protein
MGERENLQEWIQKILSDASKKEAPKPQAMPPSTKTCMDAHRDVLHLEADFQVQDISLTKRPICIDGRMSRALICLIL